MVRIGNGSRGWFWQQLYGTLVFRQHRPCSAGCCWTLKILQLRGASRSYVVCASLSSFSCFAYSLHQS